MGRKLTTEEFIKRAIVIHKGRYDYSKVDYTNAKTKVVINCENHGEFMQTPEKHLRGNGCAKCSRPIPIDTEDLVNRFIDVHGDKYDYSNVNLQGSFIKDCITCKDHGDFMQYYSQHLNLAGCPKCGILNTQMKIRKSLLKSKFEGIVQPEDHKLIPLTKGKFAKVDNEDFERVRDHFWNYNEGRALGKSGLMHRFIMNCPSDKIVDHINHDALDNRKINLRIGSRQNNNVNTRSRGGSSKYKGVSFATDGSKWISRLKHKDKTYRLGRFTNEEDAGRAYDLKAVEIHGEWAYQTLNFPELLPEYLKQLKK